jgi:glycine cleavage system regulatory protein
VSQRKLVIGFIGKDEPGLVRLIADLVSQHGGSWLESRMSQLAGRFAGIAVVQTSVDSIADLKAALQSLEQISSVVEETELKQEFSQEIKNSRILELNIVGPDRPGIVYEVSRALEQHVANVIDMETHISAAPMSGELTFSADATVEVPFEMDWQTLAEQMDVVALELGVDILLEEEPDQ